MQWDEQRQRYVVRWREAGKQRTKRFTDRDDAILFEATIQRKRVLGELAKDRLGGMMTLEEWVLERWIPEYQDHLEPRTIHWQKGLWTAHIYPHFAEVRLRDITPALVRQWQVERRRAGAGGVAMARARSLLSQILDHAVESDELPINPIKYVKPLPNNKPRRLPLALSPLQVEQIRRELTQPWDRLMVATLAYGGLRPEEAQVLEAHRILNRTMLIDLASDGRGGVKGTKTRANRAVVMLEPLAEDLDAAGCVEGYVFNTPGLRREYHKSRTNYVVPMPKHTWDNWRERTWRPAVKAALGFHIPPYDLRHSFVSLLLAADRRPHYVADQVGHDPAETISRYGHLIAEFKGAAAIDPAEEIQRARREVWGTAAAERILVAA